MQATTFIKHNQGSTHTLFGAKFQLFLITQIRAVLLLIKDKILVHF